ncbi:hypothetical protein CXF30_07785, partial [Corynebacterium bovis]
MPGDVRLPQRGHDLPRFAHGPQVTVDGGGGPGAPERLDRGRGLRPAVGHRGRGVGHPGRGRAGR